MKTKDLKKRLRKAALACISAMTLFSSILPGTVPFSPVPVSAAERISVHSTGVSGAYEEMIQYKDADAGHIVYQIDADRFNLKNADLSSFTSSNDNFKMGTSPVKCLWPSLIMITEAYTAARPFIPPETVRSDGEILSADPTDRCMI